MSPARLLVLVALLASSSIPAHSQQSQSLGDVARQLRSQKKDAPPAQTVITNDDLPSASTSNILGLDKPAGTAASAGPAAPGTADSSPFAALARVESVVKQLDVMDRGTFLKLALGGANPYFPGHENWEERLFTAKQTYVSQGFDLLQKTRQIVAGAQALKSSQTGADDPRVKELSENLKVLVQEAVRADAAFQAVVLEGRDLARQAPAH